MFFENSERKKHTQLGVVAAMHREAAEPKLDEIRRNKNASKKQAGTWSVPTEEQAKQALKELKEFQHKYFAHIGDDDLWDSIDHAQQRILELGQEGVRRQINQKQASKRKAGDGFQGHYFEELLSDVQELKNRYWAQFKSDELDNEIDKLYNWIDQKFRMTINRP